MQHRDHRGRTPLGGPPPPGCPFPRSTAVTGLSLTGRNARYTNADTWYPSWADDDVLYSPWTDGYVPERGRYEPYDPDHPGLTCYAIDGPGHTARTAQARILGDDPLALVIEVVGDAVPAAAAPYRGRYRCANLVHAGVWYYGTYALDDLDLENSRSGAGYDTLGPFVGFRISRDRGLSWSETPCTPSATLFGEDPARAPVKIGAPHVVDLGRELEHSSDGCLYLVAHGSRAHAPVATYLHGDHVYLVRVTPQPGSVNDPAAYEFFAGHDDRGQPRWSDSFDAMRPLLAWDDHLGSAAATYVPGLERFMMFVTRGCRPGAYDTLVLEAPSLTGPWSLVTYLEAFGPEAYFVNLPSKFLADGGRRGWLCYSANWTSRQSPGSVTEDPEGSTYALCLQEILIHTSGPAAAS